MKRLFFLASVIVFSVMMNAANKTASIMVDSRVKYQHVTGFGGFSPSPQWSYWLNDADMDKLFGKGENQLGLNIVRLYISNNRNFWGSSVANAKRAKKYGAFVFASPWSPPASWKSNNEVANGGSLLESRYADWANFLNDYYKYMKTQGVTIDAVSVQNEPDWKAEYESCIWTGQQMAKFLREQGSKIECKIIAPEAIHFTKSVHEPILNDAEACKHLDILGGHFYGWDGSSYSLAAQKGKEVWMTEYLINERQQNNGQNINWKDDGFLFARCVNDAMLANMSAWVHYSLKRYYGVYGDGQFGTVNNQITKRGYILSHYAKYVSGTTRVRHSVNDASGKLTSSAYITQSGDSVVIMVLNPSADTYNTTITLPFYSATGNQIVTTETQNMKKTAIALEAETYQPAVSIAPYSVSTYIFVKSAPRTDIPEEDAAAESIFADNFDLYGASCIPPGWRAKGEGNLIYAGNYSLGPRVMSFSPEGAMQYAFYFRAGDAASGYVSYGEETKYRLNLEPGKYTVSYSLVGWKTKPSVVLYVNTASGSRLAYTTSTPKTSISTNGSSSRITETSDKSLDFEITTAGNYILKWTVSKAASGLNEVLLGNIRLVRHDDSEETSVPLLQEESAPYNIYNVHGQRLNSMQRGVNIVDGKKILVR